MLEVGLSIEPGVPYCFPKGKSKIEGNILVILKSGNFGSKDFYLKVKNLS